VCASVAVYVCVVCFSKKPGQNTVRHFIYKTQSEDTRTHTVYHNVKKKNTQRN